MMDSEVMPPRVMVMLKPDETGLMLLMVMVMMMLMLMGA